MPLLVWGSNKHSQLGVGERQDAALPVRACGGGGWVGAAIAAWRSTICEAGHSSASARMSLLVGDPAHRGCTAAEQRPADLSVHVAARFLQRAVPEFGNVDVVDVAAGSFHTVVVTEFGDVYAFGRNKEGQAGVTDAAECPTPVKVPLPETATNVYCGAAHSMVRDARRAAAAAVLRPCLRALMRGGVQAITASGRLYVWGLLPQAAMHEGDVSANPREALQQMLPGLQFGPVARSTLSYLIGLASPEDTAGTRCGAVQRCSGASRSPVAGAAPPHRSAPPRDGVCGGEHAGAEQRWRAAALLLLTACSRRRGGRRCMSRSCAGRWWASGWWPPPQDSRTGSCETAAPQCCSSRTAGALQHGPHGGRSAVHHGPERSRAAGASAAARHAAPGRALTRGRRRGKARGSRRRSSSPWLPRTLRERRLCAWPAGCSTAWRSPRAERCGTRLQRCLAARPQQRQRA